MEISSRLKGPSLRRANQLDILFADYFRVDGDTIVEHEVIWDQLQMMSQLGAPSPS